MEAYKIFNCCRLTLNRTKTSNIPKNSCYTRSFLRVYQLFLTEAVNRCALVGNSTVALNHMQALLGVMHWIAGDITQPVQKSGRL
jgi:hypothetical protein